MKAKHILWIIILFLALAGAAGYYIYLQRQQMTQQMTQLEQQFELAKEDLEDEYNQLAQQYEGYKFETSNDSLIAKLEREQAKVQRLMEELRTVKATNATRVSELKKELATLRTIMRGYVLEIDSLNRVNQQLAEENQKVSQQYRQATQTITQITQENTALSERVSLASKLDASNINVTGITDKNKATDKIKNMEQLAVSFTINKNITASTGIKTIYIRIQKPDGDVLVKSQSNTFIYENKAIHYSSKRAIEYTGEEAYVLIYWKIEEFLSSGNYRVDIFADGSLIGSKGFSLG